MLLGYSTAHSLFTVMAKGKLCLNYLIIIFLQCLTLLDISVEASFLIPRCCIARRVEQSHIAWERVGRPANHTAILKKVIWFLYTSFSVCAAYGLHLWFLGWRRRERLIWSGKCRVSGSVTSWMDGWPWTSFKPSRCPKARKSGITSLLWRCCAYSKCYDLAH